MTPKDTDGSTDHADNRVVVPRRPAPGSPFAGAVSAGGKPACFVPTSRDITTARILRQAQQTTERYLELDLENPNLFLDDPTCFQDFAGGDEDSAMSSVGDDYLALQTLPEGVYDPSLAKRFVPQRGSLETESLIRQWPIASDSQDTTTTQAPGRYISAEGVAVSSHRHKQLSSDTGATHT